VGSGAWANVPIPNYSTSWNASGKAQNTYQYRIWFEYGDYWGWGNGVGDGPVTVVVGPAPPVDPLVTQLNYQFQTRQGDLYPTDGKVDIFVKRTSGGVAGNGVVNGVILKQNSSGGTFSLIAPHPDSWEWMTASGWPLSSASVVVTDFNVDGFVDVEVKGVAAAINVAGASDQIVFSPAAFCQSQPLGLRAVDASLKQFVANMLDYHVNQNYFWENANTQYFSQTVTSFDCNFGFFDGILDAQYFSGAFPCTTYYYYVAGTYLDYTGSHERAVAIWLWDESFVATGNATASTQGAQTAAEAVLGVPIGGWVMEELLGTTGEHTNPDVRRGLETFWAILGSARANAQEIDTEIAPPQVSYPDCITVNARNVEGLGWSGAKHASLVYLPAGQWISAFDDDPSFWNDGLLVSEVNDESDNPLLTMVVAEVNTPNGVPGVPCDIISTPAYWPDLINADSRYDDDLEYDPVPALGTGVFNSNGFVHGILIATYGSAWPDLFGLFGWNNPVPAQEFQ
jgi:hypothetical protein